MGRIVIKKNRATAKKIVNLLASYFDKALVKIDGSEEDGPAITLMFVNVPKRFMIHFYLEEDFFDQIELEPTIYYLERNLSEFTEKEIFFEDEGFVLYYVDFTWVPHEEEMEDCSLADLVARFDFPTINKIAQRLSPLCEAVYYKVGSETPLVICKQFPDLDASLKFFVGEF